jgi:hypothetical protein
MKFIDYEVKRAFEGLTGAIEKANAQKGASSTDRLRAWEDVCLQSRALYARYVDAALWRGAVDDFTYKNLHRIFGAAVDCLPDTVTDDTGKKQTFEVKESVRSRFEDFKRFSVGMREGTKKQHSAAMA